MAIETRSSKLADEIRRSVEGDAWHGPSVSEALQSVTVAQALLKPIDGFHSIWEITLHIAFWNTETLAVVRGQPYRDVPATDQWPPATDTSEPHWNRLVESISASSEDLAREVPQLTDQALERRMERRDYTLEFLLHGLAQHNAYHAGQIKLLSPCARL